MWVAAEEGPKTKHSINPPVLTVCLLLHQYSAFTEKVFFNFIFEFVKYLLIQYSGLTTGPLCKKKYPTEFGQFTFIHHCARRLQFSVTEKKSTPRGCQFHVCFARGKITSRCLQFRARYM